MTGLWQEIAKMFEAQTGYRVEVVATGPRPILDTAMRAGKVDLLTMHSGDITTDLVADGFGINMRPWTRNELCIVGPVSYTHLDVYKRQVFRRSWEETPA